MEIIYTQRHARHNTQQVHARNTLYLTDEIPERVERILQAVTTAGFGPVRPPEEFGDAPLLAVHDPQMIAFLRSGYTRQVQEFGITNPVFPEALPIRPMRFASTHPVALAGVFSHGSDCPLLEGTWEAAYWSAQCAISGANRLLNGTQTVYALCRPPGHHAMQDAYGGYCYLNNAAIAARYLQNTGGLRKIVILDIDYHHGNGTQEIFYHDPTVLYCSLHADPQEDYPYFWGSAEETGDGLGEGFNCNWPLPRGCSEIEYLQSLSEALDTIASYSPEALIVSLGLDIASGDPVGSFALSPESIGRIGAMIAATATSLAVPTLIVQEGGYQLETLGMLATVFLENFVV